MFVPRLLTPGSDVNFRCVVEVDVEPVAHRRGLLGAGVPSSCWPTKTFSGSPQGRELAHKEKNSEKLFHTASVALDRQNTLEEQAYTTASQRVSGLTFSSFWWRWEPNLFLKNKNISQLSIMSSK